MAMIESGKSKRVRRKLLQDQLTLAEALKYARGLESADQHAAKVENQTPADITVKQEVDKIAVDKTGRKNHILIAANSDHTKEDQENAHLSASSVRGAGKGTISRIFFKSRHEIKATKELAYVGERKSDTSS